MTELPHVFLATEWDLDGQTATGLASENLPPKWFTKEPDREPLEEIGGMVADPVLAEFFTHLLFIEQPISRKVALASGAAPVSEAWPSPAPIIIDESDGALEDLPRALELGYAGASHKNCKGVFKGLRNRCLLGAWQERHPERSFLMTGEDLANIGPVALLQDLAVQALLGNSSIERNGHHYFRGLSAWPQEWQHAAFEAHPDLYAPHPVHGWPALRITSGQIQLTSVNAAPFGVHPLFDPSPHFPPIPF